MYGPADSQNKFVPGILNDLMNNKEKILLTGGIQKRDFIFVYDVVDAYCEVVKNIETFKKNIEIEVGTGKETTIKDFVILLKELTTSNSILEFGALPYRKNEIMESKANNTLLHHLGWKPKFGLKDGLSELIRYEKEIRSI